MEHIILSVFFAFGLYAIVLIAVFLDLASGVKKAKRLGVMRTSYGYKRTVDKVARYYNALLALSVIDAMQIAAIWYFNTYYGYRFILFPFVTFIGTFGICLIEIKSIYEKAEDKVRLDNVGQLFGRVLANKDNLNEVAKLFGEYFKKEEETDNSEPQKTVYNDTSNNPG